MCRWLSVKIFISGLAVAISTFTVAFTAVPAAGQSARADEAVAKIDGHVITRGDLYAKGAGTLLQQRFDNYRAERDTLGRVIDDQLLELEAHRRNIAVAQLIEQEVEHKVKDPTDAELQVFYEGAQTDQSFESLREQ